MCWTALDRGLAIAEEQGFDAPTDRWTEIRAEIKETILDRGFDADRNTFTRSFESEELDAACLRLPLVGFLPFDDDRIHGTLDAVMDTLGVGDPTETGLVHRYSGGDGLPGEDNPFVVCSFWLVGALALSGRIEEARSIFEAVVERTSPHGLLAEEIDGETGEHRGNYPQAFSHTGLLTAILCLNAAESDRDVVPPGLQRRAM